MKFRNLLLLAFVLSACAVSAQRKQIDSLKHLVTSEAADSIKVKAYFQLGDVYLYINPDTTLMMAQRCYALAVTTRNTSYQRRSLVMLANAYIQLGNYTKGMKLYYDCIRLAQSDNDAYAIIQTYNNIGSTYIQMADYAKALKNLRLAQKNLAEYVSTHHEITQKFHKINVYILNNIEEAYLFSDRLDSAAYYINEGIRYQNTYHINELRPVFINDLGTLEGKKGNEAAASKYLRQSEKDWLDAHDLANLDLTYLSFADLFNRFHKADSAIFYAQKALNSAKQGNYLADEALAAKLLYQLYDAQHNIPLAYKYYKQATQINDSIINKDKVMELASMDFDQKQRDNELATARLAYENKIRNYVFAAGLAVLALLAFVFWRNAQQRKKANNLLQEQKEEIETQRDSLDDALNDLKATQSQLLQREKMASLGELTAGIAHEIQNPLNFVNNFSDVNKEMLVELREELNKGDIEEAKAIAADIEQNEAKINHHGKRADAIVKGMLQHSRTSSGQKEPTDINALADEYLHLAYHGLRAKDKDFNAELVTNFDQKLPKANVIPQDIGRVLLNVINNAFYATQQKAKTIDPDYKPTVEISTAQENGSLIIAVKDNGSGIPEAIKEKIMQPFFTTKPTGEGTGLGLSLSYDIVVKGHGGTIQVNSVEGEGSEFMILLPLITTI